ncbi:MAG: hypothetical protein K8R02_00845, partial [Anaerohalosphaeraceae bacterium]|nr:hypothetical protein [Anaerohalosphaeraceae bacterium]
LLFELEVRRGIDGLFFAHYTPPSRIGGGIFNPYRLFNIGNVGVLSKSIVVKVFSMVRYLRCGKNTCGASHECYNAVKMFR